MSASARLVKTVNLAIVTKSYGKMSSIGIAVTQIYNAITWRIISVCAAIVCHIAGHDWHYFTMHGDNGTAPQFFRCCMRCEKTESIEARLFRDRG